MTKTYKVPKGSTVLKPIPYPHGEVELSFLNVGGEVVAVFKINDDVVMQQPLSLPGDVTDIRVVSDGNVVVKYL